MTIILISSNGYGAGKTYLAELVGGVRAPLAYGVRRELTHMFPEFRHLIHSPSQEDKSFVLPSGKTVRQELVELGQLRCENNKTYWCEKWDDRCKEMTQMSTKLVVDDLRKLVELSWFRLHYQDVTHLHLKYSGAVAEKNRDGSELFDDLEQYADYVIIRRD